MAEIKFSLQRRRELQLIILELINTRDTDLLSMQHILRDVNQDEVIHALDRLIINGFVDSYWDAYIHNYYYYALNIGRSVLSITEQ